METNTLRGAMAWAETWSRDHHEEVDVMQDTREGSKGYFPIRAKFRGPWYSNSENRLLRTYVPDMTSDKPHPETYARRIWIGY